MARLRRGYGTLRQRAGDTLPAGVSAEAQAEAVIEELLRQAAFAGLSVRQARYWLFQIS